MLRSLVRPKGERLPKTSGDLATYQRIAKKLGFHPSAQLRAEVLAFMADHGIKTYNYDRVHRYMDREAEKHGTGWSWFPMRAVDVLDIDILEPNHDSGDIMGAAEPYKHVIPLRVLEKVELIEKKFDDAVRFYVTDYTAVDPDPFIAVYVENPNLDGDETPEGSLIIFDVWDEPGFTG